MAHQTNQIRTFHLLVMGSDFCFGCNTKRRLRDVTAVCIMYFVLISILQIHACPHRSQRIFELLVTDCEQASQCLFVQIHSLNLFFLLPYRNPPLITNFCGRFKADF